MTINIVNYPKVNKQDFPWYCEQGCFKAMYCSSERILQMKHSAVKYQLWTCPKCGNTVRVCIWREKRRC